jgi:adenylate cyclase class 2
MGTVEVEARFRLGAGCSALDAVARLGLTVGEPVRQDDQAYAPTGWDYGQDRLKVTFARLRSEGDDCLFTVKQPVTDVSTCIEYECRVDDRDAMHRAILLMGFAPTVRIVKTRQMVQVDERFALCLDEVEGVGAFLEVEAMTTSDADYDSLRGELEQLVASLELDVEPCSETYDTLVYAATRVVASEFG